MNKELLIPGTKIRLYNPSGAGSIYHIMIGDYYNGQVCKTLEGWKVYLNANSDVTKEEEGRIFEALREQ